MIVCWLLAAMVSAQQPVHIALLGDSNTWIGGDDCDQPRGWNYWLKEIVKPASCCSYARSGATWTHTEQTVTDTEGYSEVLGDNNVVYNQIRRLQEAVENGAQVVPDVVVVMAGTNDMWFASRRPGLYGETVDEVFANSMLMERPVGGVLSLAASVRYGCEWLRRLFPEARLVLMTPMQCTKVSVAEAERTGDVIEECGKRLGAEVIRLDKEGCVRRAQELRKFTNTSDGVHTNKRGAQCIGKLVAERLF